MHLFPSPTRVNRHSHHFLQVSYPVFVLIHCFSPLLTWLVYFFTHFSLLLLFSSLLFFLCPFLHFCFFINLSLCFYPSKYNISLTMTSLGRLNTIYTPGLVRKKTYIPKWATWKRKARPRMRETHELIKPWYRRGLRTQ